MSPREPRVVEEEVGYLGPVAIAQFIDARWIAVWPMTWTKAGLNAIRNGYGRWTGTRQRLLYGNGITEIAGGTANWPGRRAALSGN